MKSEEEIIAQYIKEKHPEILVSVDFITYFLKNKVEDFINDRKMAKSTRGV